MTDTDGPISSALQDWNTRRTKALDEIEQAHRVVAELDPGQGQPYAIRQIHQAYTVLLSSQFQGFCRDLHSQCAAKLEKAIPHPTLREACKLLFSQDRKLSKGNPNPGNIGSDFGRFGLVFWEHVETLDCQNQTRRGLLEELNKWRNAVSHQDFESFKLSADALGYETVLSWRAACQGLAISFDEVMRQHIESIVGDSPW